MAANSIPPRAKPSFTIDRRYSKKGNAHNAGVGSRVQVNVTFWRDERWAAGSYET
jgi:hypothetical protein